MKVYIFFDTNVLEIPERKNLSLFSFSSSYKEALAIIKKFNLEGNVIVQIPGIVINELLEHYKADFKSKVQSAKSKIENINSDLNGVIKEEIVMRPIYGNREYYEFITKSMEEYLDKHSIPTCDCPDQLSPIAQRAIQGRQPFKVIKHSNKTYSDAGLKDAIIWETITSCSFDEDDIVILYTKDNDFEEQYLQNELSNTIKVARSNDALKSAILDIFEIDEELFECKEYIKTQYFSEQLKSQLAVEAVDSTGAFQLLEISLAPDYASVARWYNTDQIDLPINDAIEVDLAVTMKYKCIASEEVMSMDINISCYLENREISLISYDDIYELSEGKVINNECVTENLQIEL